jgi:D-aminopeptidase
VGGAEVEAALAAAASGPVAEGCVGAGTGTRCLGFKGGIGTASRVVRAGSRQATIGVLAQTNFGASLRVLGAPVGAELADGDPDLPEAGSCMLVVATDAPLDARQLTRAARRAVFALARSGAAYADTSGDYAVAFSTVRVSGSGRIADEELNQLFAGVLEAV